MSLEGLLAVITGATGNIGEVITRRYLEEGAKVIATGRSLDKLNKLKNKLIKIDSDFEDKLNTVVIDAANLDELLVGIQEIKTEFGKIDVLVNNAGSAGPQQTIDQIPITKQNLDQLNIEGLDVKECLEDAINSLLWLPWAMTVTLLPQLNPGASIINVSTIFSRTNYYGRGAYTVPKASLNILSHLMSKELGVQPFGIRVNTVFPGPVESERIHHVFSTMDELRGEKRGTTEKQVTSKMLLHGIEDKDFFVSKEDVADTIVFLGSQHSRQYTNQEFRIARGMQTKEDDTIELTFPPNSATVNLNGHFTWIIGGNEFEEPAFLANRHYYKYSQILLTYRSEDAVEEAKKRFKDEFEFSVKRFDPLNDEDWNTIIHQFSENMHFPSEYLIFPRFSSKELLENYGDSVMQIPIEKTRDYLTSEITDVMSTAKWLSKLSRLSEQRLGKTPATVFISNRSDGKGNKLNAIRSAGIEQMIRIWREEEHVRHKAKEFSQQKIWQIIRFQDKNDDNLEFTSDLAISISTGATSIPQINMLISNLTSKNAIEFTYNRQYHHMLRSLDGTVAIVTGGSEGIGRETTRILAQSGAHVAIASRSQHKLSRTKEFLVEELTANGFPEASQRIYTTELDVTKEVSIKAMFEDVVTKFGRIDYLINNAGITGEEELITDMDVPGWKTTLQANLASNYDLLLRSLPYMKQQKNGYIINISSVFGGMKYAAPAYPIRADYAVTKAGQRALSECFASLLGPEVKINTISPGPVDGDRLHGTDSHPGLYHRRAIKNIENKRIGSLYNILIDIEREGGDLLGLLDLICLNVIEQILKIERCPTILRTYLEKLTQSGSGYTDSSMTHLLTKKMAEKLLNRLSIGNKLQDYNYKDHYFKNFTPPPEPFLSFKRIEAGAEKISSRIIASLALNRMPSEYEVGREIALNLSDKCMTGQTLFPSCGVVIDSMAVSGQIGGGFHSSLFEHLEVSTVMLIGNSMPEEMAKVVEAYYQGKKVNKIVVVAGSAACCDTIETHLISTGIQGNDPRIVLQTVSIDSIESQLELHTPEILISFPYSSLPEGGNDWEELPCLEDFNKLIETHLTNHFKVSKRSSLIDYCRVFFVTDPSSASSGRVTKAFAEFLATTLAPLTITAGTEASRLTHKAMFYQLNARPFHDRSYYQEKLVNALLLLSLPYKERNIVEKKNRYQYQTGQVFLLS